ncbi:MAG: hypothetical protein Kow00108_18910 [Calditrichia bacterium]
MKNLWATLIIFYLSGLTLVLNSCDIENKTNEKILPRVHVYTFEPEIISERIPITGRLSPAEEMKLSFKTGGIIESIRVGEGQSVKRGEVLASLKLEEVKALYEGAKAALENAAWHYQRLEKLQKEQVVSESVLEEAKMKLEAARSKYRQVEFNLTNSVIRAPEDGIVLKIIGAENEMVAPGMPVLMFGTGKTYWKITTSVSSKDIKKVKPGDSCRITLDSTILPAVVSEIAGVANPTTGSYEVTIRLAKSDQSPQYRSGEIVHGYILTQQLREMIYIPIEFIMEAREDYIVVAAVDSGNVVQINHLFPQIWSDSGVYILPEELKWKNLIKSDGTNVEPGDTVNPIWD